MSARRKFLAAAAALIAAPAALAQSKSKGPTLGILNPHTRASAPRGRENPVNAVLSRRGWIPGESIFIEAPDAGGSEQRMPAIAAELVEKRVDVIFALGPEAAVAAARATTTIPIVFWGVMYPVEAGLIDSFARPGRNVTGVAFTASPESDAKRLELLHEIAPAAHRLAFLSTPISFETVSGRRRQVAALWSDAARSVGYEFREFPIEKREDLPAAFAAILGWRAQALVGQPSTLINRERARIIGFANDTKLPSAFTLWDYVESGGLLSYGIDWRPTMARSIEYVDRILRGANAAELPVELPTEYVLAVNLKTAKHLGLTIPQSVLVRADRVIE